MMHSGSFAMSAVVTFVQCDRREMEMLSQSLNNAGYWTSIRLISTALQSEFPECLADCCKAFESVMKVICKNKYGVDKSNETVGTLVNYLKAQNFFRAFMGEHLTQFSGMLTSTVNTIRNKMGGHGAGVAPVPVPEEYAAFALHSTAADILLLTKLAK